MNNRGFTLIEILIYVGLLAIITSTISSFLLWTTRSNIKTKVMRETLDNARRTMEIITHEIKEAESIYLPNTTSTQLSLETTHYLPEGEKITYIDFYLCGDKLCLKKESQAPIALISDRVKVKNLSFIQIAGTSTHPSIQVNLGIDYKNPANLPEYQALVNLTSTISLRNY
jgi:prepilin-type N-terminal cleavage/methylation domain-containing protein